MYPKSGTPNPQPHNLDHKLRTPNPKPQAPDLIPHIFHPRPHTLNLKPQTPNPKPQTPNPKHQISNTKLKPHARHLEPRRSKPHTPHPPARDRISQRHSGGVPPVGKFQTGQIGGADVLAMPSRLQGYLAHKKYPPPP